VAATPIEGGGDRIRLTVEQARSLGEAAIQGAGCDTEEAGTLADHALDAALCGYEYSGLPKLLSVVDYPDFKLPRRPVSVLRETGASATLDGGKTQG
jgi:LDH2 family malate/lactate/ureidoglycolate dehydrogenase